jgi:hypothetical protein
MRREERKAAIAAYKERKIVGGVYLIRCERSGEIWVGQWPDLDTIQNRIWFTLQQGAHPNQDLQESWRQYGAEQFQFEVLERIDNETTAYVRNATLKERAIHWQFSLNARSI